MSEIDERFNRLGLAVQDASAEVIAAMARWPQFNSAHEGFSVLNEEVDELWEHVKVKQGSRNISAMRKEAVQVAAMALRFIVDVCHEEKGNK